MDPERRPLSELKFDHIGIALRSLAEGRTHLRALFGIVRWTAEFDDPLNRIRVQFGRDGSGIVYELIAPNGPEGPVGEALRTGSRILNHVAYLTPDLEQSAERLRRGGCMPFSDPTPAIAYDGRPIQFFISRYRFLIELIEAPDHQHRFETLFEGSHR